MKDIKETLCKRGSLTIRGVNQVFKQIDQNRNKRIDGAELEYGLRNLDISLND